MRAPPGGLSFTSSGPCGAAFDGAAAPATATAQRACGSRVHVPRLRATPPLTASRVSWQMIVTKQPVIDQMLHFKSVSAGTFKLGGAAGALGY